MGENCVLVINLMARDYFRGITKLNQEKMAIAENFYPPPPPQKKWEVHVANKTPENGFQVKFQAQNVAHTPPYANMASTPWVRDYSTDSRN